MREMMGHVVSRMTRRIAVRATCGAAGRAARAMTRTATCPVPDQIACETSDEGLRTVTAETIRQTMYDIPFPTKDEIALLTMDEATVRTTSRTIREVIPYAGVPFEANSQ